MTSMTGASLLLAIFCLLASKPLSVVMADSELRLQSGQYHRLLIFVEDPRGARPPGRDSAQLIHRIKDGFQDASRLLHNLTTGVGRPLRFGSASILVSAQLGRELRAAGLTVGDAQWQRRSRPDFIVTHGFDAAIEGSVAMDIGCGKPGKNVVMLNSSFTNESPGAVERKIALYFSQYRWGLLSEQPIGSPIETGPDGELRVSACSAELNVSLEATDGSATCKFDVKSRRTTRGCAPRLSVTQPDGPLASFMFAPFHRAVNRFCDGESRDPRLKHNRMVDSLMNRQCDGLSAAEVIRLHSDYRTTASGAHPTLRDVTFDLVAEKSNRRVVVVMDVSGSMSGHRIAMMISAVSQFLMELIEDGSECALISFTDSYQVISGFVRIQTRAQRELLSNQVAALVATGGTCIGGAVRAAASMLGLNDRSQIASVTGQIILLSDGEEGCSVVLESVINLLSGSNVQVVSIRYGDSADARMDLLADVTGGMKFFGGSNVADISGLRLALGGTTIELEESKRTLTLTSDEIRGKFTRRKFSIDDSVKRDLVFRVTVPTDTGAVSQLRLILSSPSGKVFGYSDSVNIYEVNAAIGTIAIRVPDSDIETGFWYLRDEAAESRPESAHSTGSGGSIVITGRSSENSIEAPVVLTAQVRPSVVSSISEDTKIVVYARLLRGHAPVLHGRMYATVRSDTQVVAEVNLIDNGAGADLKASDGIYSAYLPVAELNQPRDFAISVTSLYPVSRVASASKVTVQRQNPYFNRQLVPPAKVIDLQLTVNAFNESALLHWTAVEDPMRHNASAKYEIRFSSSHEQLLGNFSACQTLAVLSRDDQLGAPGSTVQLNLFHQLAGRGSIFLAVVGVSQLNISGPHSNLVSVDLTPPSLSELMHIGLLPSEDSATPSKPEPRFSVLGLILGLPFAVICFAAMAWKLHHGCMLKNQTPANPENPETALKMVQPDESKKEPDVNIRFANDYFDHPAVVTPNI